MRVDGTSTLSFPRNIDGFEDIDADGGTFNDNVTIDGDLTVTGTISGVTVGGSGSYETLTVEKNYDGETFIVTRNTSAGSNALTTHRFVNDTAQALVLFLNSSGRLSDGGANAATLRNDGGKLFLGSSTGSIEISTYVSTALPLYVTNTTESTSISTGAQTIDGGLGVLKNINAGGNIIAPLVQSRRDFDGVTVLSAVNTTAGTSAYAGVSLTNDVGSANLFLNSSARPTDGGVNTMTVRNDVGALRLQGSTGAEVVLTSETTTNTPINVTNPTASTSTITGAVKVTGGVGILGNLNVGGTISGTFNLTALPTLTITDVTGQTFIVNSTTDSTSTTTGAVKILGGLGIGGSLYSGGTLNAVSAVATNNVDGPAVIRATNTNSGANAFPIYQLQNDSGSANIFLNSSTRISDGNANMLTIRNDVGETRLSSSGATITLGANVSTAQVLQITNATAATSTITGALQVGGGAGIVGSLYVGGFVTFAGGLSNINVDGESAIAITNPSTGTSAYSTLRLGNDGVSSTYLFLNSSTRTADGPANSATLRNDAGDLRLFAKGNNGLTVAETTGNVNAGSTTQSTSTSTGGLVTPGGVGVAKNLYVGGNINLTGSLIAGTTTSWTPAISTGTTITYTAQVGHSYQLGSMVILTGYILTTSAIDIGAANLEIPIPFTNATPGRALGSAGTENYALPSSTDTINCMVDASQSNMYLICWRDGLGGLLVQSPLTAASRSIFFQITLFV